MPSLLGAAAGLIWLLPVPTDRITTLIAAPVPRLTIPAGTFRMGASAEDLQLARSLCADELRSGGGLLAELLPRCGSRFDSEGPQAEVFLPEYAIDRTEVTVGAYAACVAAGACRSALQVSLAGDPSLPVERVTWQEATAFCRFRAGRLPSEAEWEKAARGRDGRRIWPWGSSWQEHRTNHGRSERLVPSLGLVADQEALDGSDGFSGRAPVASFPDGVSPYGLMDSAGNVWEWTSGYFAREPPQSAGRFDPRGPAVGNERTVRGGSYRSPPSDLRLSRRLGLAPGERLPGVGFRCAYDPQRER